MHLTIIVRLQYTLRNTLELATPEDMENYKEALLWMFFYAARYESRVNAKHPTKTPNPSQIWFTKNFSHHVQRLKLSNWGDVQEILESFVFYDFLEQDLETWMEDTLRNFPLA